MTLKDKIDFYETLHSTTTQRIKVSNIRVHKAYVVADVAIYNDNIDEWEEYKDEKYSKNSLNETFEEIIAWREQQT